jgi:hypothetical protein
MAFIAIVFLEEVVLLMAEEDAVSSFFWHPH